MWFKVRNVGGRETGQRGVSISTSPVVALWLGQSHPQTEISDKDGAPRETRTPTPLPETDFESAASTDSATGALC